MQQLQGQGKDASSLLPVAQQYNAMPKYMAQVSKLRQQLQDNPSSLSDSDIEHLYAEEAFRPDGSFRLPASSGLALSREMSARNLWGVRDQIVQSHPELSYLPDQKDLQSMYPTQMATPGQNETKPQPAPLQPSQLLTQPAPAPQPTPTTGDQTQQTGGNQSAATPPLGGNSAPNPAATPGAGSAGTPGAQPNPAAAVAAQGAQMAPGAQPQPQMNQSALAAAVAPSQAPTPTPYTDLSSQAQVANDLQTEKP